MRAVSGCPRLLIELGSTGTLLKRFTFKDPYNPVSAALVRLVLWRIVVFYMFAASAVLLALRSPRGRPFLWLLALAGLPMLYFAIFLFEPSSPERFLPVLPFLLLTISASWDAAGKFANALRSVIVLFACLLPIINWPSFAGRFSTEGGRAHAQLDEFRRNARPNDILATVLLQEPVNALVNQDLFDPINRPAPARTFWMVNVADARAARWREDFASLVRQTWHEGNSVWIVKSALVEHPDPRSAWVEGDNPTVHWAEIPAFLRTLSYDAETPGSGGFARIRRSLENEAALDRVNAK